MSPGDQDPRVFARALAPRVRRFNHGADADRGNHQGALFARTAMLAADKSGDLPIMLGEGNALLPFIIEHYP
jgi:hypothetical protein